MPYTLVDAVHSGRLRASATKHEFRLTLTVKARVPPGGESTATLYNTSHSLGRNRPRSSTGFGGTIATSVIRSNAGRHSSLRFDNFFFPGMAVVILATVFIGFARSYYLAGVFRAPLPNLLVHIHGAVFSSWIVLLITQTSLVAAGRVDLTPPGPARARCGMSDGHPRPDGGHR
jgi:hypothetical protein